MARPQKERVICSAPKFLFFAPQKSLRGESVVLTLDEYEVIRLHDLEHLPQADVAAQMLISRPTVTALLNTAHEKIADAKEVMEYLNTNYADLDVEVQENVKAFYAQWADVMNAWNLANLEAAIAPSKEEEV